MLFERFPQRIISFSPTTHPYLLVNAKTQLSSQEQLIRQAIPWLSLGQHQALRPKRRLQTLLTLPNFQKNSE